MNNLETISEKSLTVAWAKVFLKVMSPGNDALEPIVVSVYGIGNAEPVEEFQTRMAINDVLRKKGKPTIAETAATIFPYRAWNFLGRPACAKFSSWYLMSYLPRHGARMKKTGHRW